MFSRFRCFGLGLGLVVAGVGCRASRGAAKDGGADVPMNFGDAGAGAGNGAMSGTAGTGGLAGATATAGTAGGLAGASMTGGTGAGAGGGAGSAGTEGAGSGGSVAGTIGSGGGRGGGSGGEGGTMALFPCIAPWPTRPAGMQKTAPLSIQPGVLWTKTLPSTAPIAGAMATTGNGVVLSSGSNLLIYDGGGNIVASVAKPQPAGNLSSPVVGPDGGIYFADSATVQRVDATGRQIWQKPLGANTSGSEFARPGSPAIDTTGRLFLPALDGKLWILRAENGDVLASPTLGLRSGVPRSIGMGIGSILFVDRTGIAAAGAGIGAQGLLAADSASWVGEIVVGSGASPVYTIAGYEIGVVASGYQDTTSEVLDTFVVDRCGNLRWRVPGAYTVPLRITFDDDLIVMDRTPVGGGKYDYSLSRFSKDGALRAGPVPVTDQACGSFFVGADDTFYYTGGASDGYRLRAFDSSLREMWVTPFPHCPDAAVLSADGTIFTARAAGAQFAAVQTTSPGPALVSWGQAPRDARATKWLAP